MSEDVSDKVRAVVRRYIIDRGKTVEPDVPLRDLGLKPIDVLQIIMDVEDAWEGVVYIDDDQAENIQTVADIERLVSNQLAA